MVFKLQNKSLIACLFPFLLPVTACGEAALQAQINELKAQLVELSKNQARLQVRVDNNNQLLTVLAGHSGKKSQETPAVQVVDNSLRPPEHLQVVKLGPENTPLETLAEPAVDLNAMIGDETESPNALMQKAEALFSRGDYDSAQIQYMKYLSYYSENADAPKALFKLGEIAYQNQEFNTAVQFYSDVLERSPKSKIAPDACLKMAYAQEKLDKKEACIASLRKLIEKYPDTIAAKKARVKLMQSDAAE